eukprot:4548906-Pleurochrysis_carterae.AAC.1
MADCVQRLRRLSAPLLYTGPFRPSRARRRRPSTTLEDDRCRGRGRTGSLRDELEVHSVASFWAVLRAGGSGGAAAAVGMHAQDGRAAAERASARTPLYSAPRSCAASPLQLTA